MDFGKIRFPEDRPSKVAILVPLTVKMKTAVAVLALMGTAAAGTQGRERIEVSEDHQIDRVQSQKIKLPVASFLTCPPINSFNRSFSTII